jgi:hypothetical protein
MNSHSSQERLFCAAPPEANAEAIDLYKDEGYQCVHTFDAAVWLREAIA